MKKRWKIRGILLGILIFLASSICVYGAGTASVTLSSPSGNVESTVTVSGTVKGSEKFAAATVIMTYDQNSLEFVSGESGVSGGAGRITFFVDAVDNPVTSKSFKFTMKIKKSGTHSIGFGNIEVVSDSDMQEMSVSKSGGKITGKVPTSGGTTGGNQGGTTGGNQGGTTGGNQGGNQGGTTTPNKDSNSKLSTLDIYPGTLSPAFDAGTTNYSVMVEGDVTEVTISATTQSSKATVTVSGGKDLQMGENEAAVIVVAENGNTMTYAIKIIREESKKINVNGVDYIINNEISDEEIPVGFSRTEIKYNDKAYVGLKHGKANLVLVSLKADDKTELYIYDEAKQEFYTFVKVQFSAEKYIILMPLQKDNAEFKETLSVEVNGKGIETWKVDEEYCVVSAINQDGLEMLYRYDKVDGTFQRYTGMQTDVVEQVETDKTLFPNNYYMYAIVGLGGFSVILLIAMIYFIASRKARHEGRKKKAIRRAEKQRAREEREAEKQRQIEEKKLAKQNKKNKEE